MLFKLLTRGACVTLACVGLVCVAHARDTGAVVVPLKASSYNAGHVGQATLLPEGGATRIVLWFSGVPWDTTLPVHVYTYLYEGSCSALPERPAMSLNDRVRWWGVTGRRGPSLGQTARMPMDELLSGRYALALRSAPADGNELIYCGDLRRG
jgi:hypothetical protein